MNAKFSKDLLAHLATLSCLECDASELDQLNEVDTSVSVPVNTNAGGTQNQMRIDEAEPFANGQDLLINAPERVGNLICVPPVISKET